MKPVHKTQLINEAATARQQCRIGLVRSKLSEFNNNPLLLAWELVHLFYYSHQLEGEIDQHIAANRCLQARINELEFEALSNEA